MWLVTCFWRERWNPSSLSQGLELGCGKLAKSYSRTIWCIYQIQFLALLRLSLRDPASTGEPVQVNLTRLGLVSGVALHAHSASWADRKCSWDWLLLQLSCSLMLCVNQCIRESSFFFSLCSTHTAFISCCACTMWVCGISSFLKLFWDL